MNEILQLNVLALYLIYGLSFYTMGVAVALQYRSYSSFRLAHSLSLLAAFALLHGLSEWGSVFIPVKVPNFGALPLWKLIAIQRMLQSISYFFLFCFGAKLIADTKNQNYLRWLILPILAFLGWIAEYSNFVFLVGTDGLLSWLVNSESWSRYLLALPAGILTTCGLALQIPDAGEFNDRSVLRNLIAAAVAFALFAVFSGLVVPHPIGWFGQFINAENFKKFTGMPIEVFRTATALLATWSITRLLVIFDLEKQRQVAESRRLETVFRERERFARDLHDDVIQSIYGVGLELQTTSNLIRDDTEKAAGQINSSVARLNEVIRDLRAYIHGLENQTGDKDLKTLLAEMVRQFRQKTGLNIKLNVKLDQVDRVRPTTETGDWQNQILQVIREALNNVVRHARASKAQVDIHIIDSTLIVAVKDNGRGLPPEGEVVPGLGNHLGMRNMKTRTDLLGGELHIISRPDEGTKLLITVPLTGGIKLNTGQTV